MRHRVPGGGRCACERNPEQCRGGGGAGVEVAHPALADDEMGGHQGVRGSGVEVGHGLLVGEVGEEVGQERHEAVKRLPATIRLQVLFWIFRLLWRGSGDGAGEDGVDEDVGDGIQEAEAEA